jgi:hypothetical protein
VAARLSNGGNRMTFHNNLGCLECIQTHRPAIWAPGSTASVEWTPLPNHGWSNKVWTVLCGLGGGPNPLSDKFWSFKPSFHCIEARGTASKALQ